MPEESMDGADERLVRLIGPQRRHPEKRYVTDRYFE